MSTGLTGKRNHEILSNVHDPGLGALRTTLAGTTAEINTTQQPFGETALFYGNYQNLAIGATYNVIQYITPVGNPVYLQKVYFSGTQVGTATIYKNSSELLKIRLSPAVFTQVLDLATGSAFGVKLAPGDIIEVEAINNGTGLADFDASLQLMET